ncbi:hypothetical protein QEZ48_19545 [Aquamicrobium lusatiense]|uniref:hypothetical protein n=1 Tax=Aquamicrobium lusatiense TaxID=89772 RepID=UPI002454DA50|nr:hypothetical protein [Aquamicrobium lusatiense]MDH4993012.1 hypothetical protein [Aquamicrobium lusatiense]
MTEEQKLEDITACVSADEIDAEKTPSGGWTKASLKKWGVSWPPVKGWRQKLIENFERS